MGVVLGFSFKRLVCRSPLQIWMSVPSGLTGKLQYVNAAWGVEGFEAFSLLDFICSHVYDGLGIGIRNYWRTGRFFPFFFFFFFFLRHVAGTIVYDSARILIELFGSLIINGLRDTFIQDLAPGKQKLVFQNLGLRLLNLDIPTNKA